MSLFVGYADVKSLACGQRLFYFLPFLFSFAQVLRVIGYLFYTGRQQYLAFRNIWDYRQELKIVNYLEKKES